MSKQPKSVDDIITESGHTLSNEVEAYIKNRPWRTTDTASYYTDYVDGKNKEMDIVATFTRDVPKWWRNQWTDFTPYKIAIRLFIESKYINKDIVLWDTKLTKNEIKKHIYETASGIKMVCNNDSASLTLDTIVNWHHYNDRRIFHQTSQEWDDFIYKARTQALHSLIHYRHKPNFSDNAQYVIDYPVVITKRFNTLFDSNKDNINANFIYSVKNYAYNTGTSNFFIDFVSYELLEKFLIEIEQEIDILWKQFYAWSERQAHSPN